MLVTTTLNLEGFRIKEYKGVVRGIVVRAPTIAQGFRGKIKSIVGGNIGAFAEMCEQTRQQAYDLLVQHAKDLGANAIIGLHYDTADVSADATEVLCYGTAILIERRIDV